MVGDSLRLPDDLGKTIDKMEKQMYEHARALEFEQAASLRDDITDLKRRYFVDAPVARERSAMN